jgi:hypothetical protein
MRVMSVLKIVSATSIAVVAISCSDSGIQQGRLKDECLRLAVYNATDERCAIEVAKEEIVRRQGGVAYGKFSASYDTGAQAWSVMAAVEPMVPGGHVSILVGRDGKVRDFVEGR